MLQIFLCFRLFLALGCALGYAHPQCLQIHWPFGACADPILLRPADRTKESPVTQAPLKFLLSYISTVDDVPPWHKSLEHLAPTSPNIHLLLIGRANALKFPTSMIFIRKKIEQTRSSQLQGTKKNRIGLQIAGCKLNPRLLTLVTTVRCFSNVLRGRQVKIHCRKETSFLIDLRLNRGPTIMALSHVAEAARNLLYICCCNRGWRLREFLVVAVLLLSCRSTTRKSEIC